MKLKFVRKHQEIEGIWSFFFDPVEPLEWLAGQSIRLEIPRPNYGYDERRFTIATAPFEKQIRITTRLSGSEFKQSLNKLEPGDITEGHNVEGDFVWNESDSPKLFLAAGIGITPFRSILAERIHSKKPLDTTLVYSSRNENVVFEPELKAWATQCKDLNMFITHKRLIVGPDDSSLPDSWLKSLVYVSGPEMMVRSISKGLIEHGLPPSHLKLDEFTGNLDIV